MANHRYKRKRSHNKPSSSRISYFKYLKTPHWKAVRFQALKMYKSCVLCNSKKKLNVHHRNYDHLFEEIITEDLVVLCKPCHGIYHGKSEKQEDEKYRKPDIPKIYTKKDIKNLALNKKIRDAYNRNVELAETNKNSIGAKILEAYQAKEKQRRN